MKHSSDSSSKDQHGNVRMASYVDGVPQQKPNLRGKSLAHKYPRTTSSNFQPKSIRTPPQVDNSAYPYRHVTATIHQQKRRDSFPAIMPRSDNAMEMGNEETTEHSDGIYPWPREHNCGLPITERGNGLGRLEIGTQTISKDYTLSKHLSSYRYFASRSNNQLPDYVSWKKDPDAWKVNAFTLDWGNLGTLYLFLPGSQWEDSDESENRSRARSHSDCTALAKQTMVATVANHAHEASDETALQPNNNNRPVREATPQSFHGSTYSNGILYIRDILTNRGLSESAVEPILASWRTSTQKSYSSIWNKWRTWCDQRRINPLYPPQRNS